MKTPITSSLTIFFVLFSLSINAQWSSNPVLNTAISTATGGQGKPNIISDGSGGAIITWSDYRSGTNNDIYVQRINAAGIVQWTTNGVAVCTASNHQYYPNLISDGFGGAIITWFDYRNGTDLNYHIYSQRVDATGVVQWTTNGVAICTANNSQDNFNLIPDGLGGAIIAWRDSRNGYSNNDIFAQRINATGIVQWTTNGVIICSAVNHQENPVLISDGLGGAIITWYDLRGGTYYNIYAQRINAAGIVQWVPNGVPVCAKSNVQRDPNLIPDGSGGAIIGWHEINGSNNYDIYAQRLNSAGLVQWNVNGVEICNANNLDYYILSMISDGSDGAIFAWHDYRNGFVNPPTNADIYAQRINGSGAIQWTNNGVPVCISANSQIGATLISDGLGGVIITWNDQRAGISFVYDIYAQRVNSLGLVQWTTNGTPICTASNTQDSPNLISNGLQGAIITWEDKRSGQFDIYAQNICANGIIGDSSCSLGIDENDFTETINLLPNPNKGSFTISSRFVLNRIIILDLLGKEVLNIAPNSLITNIQMNNQATGMYFIKLVLENKVTTKKFVVY